MYLKLHHPSGRDFPSSTMNCSVVAGIDPSGGKSPWGIARLRRASRGLWILEAAMEVDTGSASYELPHIVGGTALACIDAPLSPSGGRSFRPHERAALRLGARLLPLTTPGMAALLRAGIALAMLLGEAGIRVLEVHPGSIRGDVSLSGECEGLGSPHVLDAVVAGVVCAQYCEGKAVLVCSRMGCLALTFRRALLKGGRGHSECLAVI